MDAFKVWHFGTAIYVLQSEAAHDLLSQDANFLELSTNKPSGNAYCSWKVNTREAPIKLGVCIFYLIVLTYVHDNYTYKNAVY